MKSVDCTISLLSTDRVRNTATIQPSVVVIDVADLQNATWQNDVFLAGNYRLGFIDRPGDVGIGRGTFYVTRESDRIAFCSSFDYEGIFRSRHLYKPKEAASMDRYLSWYNIAQWRTRWVPWFSKNSKLTWETTEKSDIQY